MADKKIVIIYGSSGAGHKIACRAIEQALLRAGFKGELKIIDIVEHMPGLVSKAFSSGYLWMAAKVPWLWYAIYESGGKLYNFRPPGQLKTSLLKLILRKVNHMLIDENPDYIVSTYFTASWLAGRYKYLYNPNCRIATVVTDYGLHPSWITPNQDRYFVADESLKHEVSFFTSYTGVSMEKITNVGIPVEQRFTQPKDKEVLREKHDIAKDRFNILIIAGAYGQDHVEAIIDKLVYCKSNIQMLVVAREAYKLNSKLTAKLDKSGIPIVLYGMIDFLDELMALSDIAITKTGGLTSTECMNSGCPLMVYLPYPGQEERNSSLFLEKQAAWRLYQLESLPFKIDKLVANPDKHQAMITAARQTAQPEAANEIARLVLSDLNISQ